MFLIDTGVRHPEKKLAGGKAKVTQSNKRN
jgi:hypothetical protein